MKSNMQHVSPSPLRNRFCIPFSNTILMMCAYTTKSIFLIQWVTIHLERFESKDTVIGMIFLNCYTLLPSNGFRLAFIGEGLAPAVEYWQKLNTFPLAWSTKSVPQEYPTYSRPKVWGNRPITDLVGNVGDMLVTCRANTSMSANFPDIPFIADILSCQFGYSRSYNCWEMLTFP